MTRVPPPAVAAPRRDKSSLTLAEAAQILGLSVRAVREYVRRGELKGRRIRGRWRFRRADIDAFWREPAQWDFVTHGE